MSQPASAVSAGRALTGRIPDFFVVGHAKSGTTALYEMLRAHPAIFMPSVKEPQFFARNPDPAAVGTFAQTGRRGETLEQYLSLFAGAADDQLVGEASTFYLWSERAPRAIAALAPRARIVAILREPASFVRSLHLQMLQNGSESERDLMRALALEQERRAGRSIPKRAQWPEALMYSQRVRYAEQLRRYEERFGRDRMLVLLYDDFQRDNAGTVREVLRFLGVDESVPLAPVRANPSVEVRSLRLERLTRDVRAGRGPAARAVFALLDALTTPRLRRRLLYPLRRRLLFREPPPPDEAVLARLRERFAPEVAAAGEYLGRDLAALWGYDRPA